MCRRPSAQADFEHNTPYDQGGRANDEGTTLRQAALATGYVSAADFDRIVDPAAMVGRP